MPEVIERGFVPEWPREIRCAKETCQALLKVNLEDLRFNNWKVSGYWFDGTATCEDKFTFKCPRCGTEANGNEIPEGEIPIETQKTLRQRRRT